MSEFETRRKAGLGEFITQEQIDQHNSAYPTELLRMFSSINEVPTTGGGGTTCTTPSAPGRRVA